jgi:hypothetical protein
MEAVPGEFCAAAVAAAPKRAATIKAAADAGNPRRILVFIGVTPFMIFRVSIPFGHRASTRDPDHRQRTGAVDEMRSEGSVSLSHAT